MTVLGNGLRLNDLPGDRELHWQVEAISWGGRRSNAGGPGMFKTPAAKGFPGAKFVSEMPWESATAGAGNTVHRNTNLYGKPISIGRHIFERGVWTHAFNDATPADVVLDVAGRPFDTFAAQCGIEDAANGGSAQFQVLVDGELKVKSPVLRPGASFAFDVPVHGARKLHCACSMAATGSRATTALGVMRDLSRRGRSIRFPTCTINGRNDRA